MDAINLILNALQILGFLFWFAVIGSLAYAVWALWDNARGGL